MTPCSSRTGWNSCARRETPSGGRPAGHLVRGRPAACRRATGTVKVLVRRAVQQFRDRGRRRLRGHREVLPGAFGRPNPEVEVGAALSAARTTEVPATLGWVTGEWLRRRPTRPGAVRAGRPAGRTGGGPRVPRRRTGCLAAGRRCRRGGSRLHRRGPRPGRSNSHGPPAGSRKRSAFPPKPSPGAGHCARSSPACPPGLGGGRSRRRAL